jgi:hypothetical protein
MTIWVALALSGYTLHLLWQCASLLRRPPSATSRVPFFVLPFFISKLALLAVAASYWIPSYCQYAKLFSPRLLMIPAALAVLEAYAMYFTIKENVSSLRLSPRFYPAIAWQVLVSVAFPAALLLVAYNELAWKQCAL